MVDRSRLEKAVQQMLPSLVALAVFDNKGRKVFSYGKSARIPGPDRELIKGFPRGLRQLIAFYDDKVVVWIKFDKGSLRAVFPEEINIPRNLLRLYELERIVWE